MSRREFPKSVKAEIVRRSMTKEGLVACEGCGLILGKKPYDIDHTIADALFLDKSRKLTADDGKLLGKECCHDQKTREHDIPIIAKAKRREARDLGITRPAGNIKSRGFAKTQKPAKTSRWDFLPPLEPVQLFKKEPQA